jgi:hypothetical protein
MKVGACPSYYYTSEASRPAQILSDSDMPPAKAQRRQVRKKKLTVHKQIHDLFSKLCALAPLREIFRLFFFAPFAFFAAILLFFGCGFAALGSSW